MNINRSLSSLLLVVAFMLAASPCLAGPIKGGVAVSTVNKHGKVSRQQLNANPLYKQGIGFFNKKNYAEAMNRFQTLDATGYCCDMIHYYIGQCYQNTNQTVAAQMHYNWVMEKSKDKTLVRYADYANQCLAYYSGHRTYSGQGNNFARYSSGGRGGGGGGGGGSVSFG